MANQDYEGPIPPAATYDPNGMKADNKAEFEQRYADQVGRKYVFNLRRKMEAYCVSDIKLLKAGCQARFRLNSTSKVSSTRWRKASPSPRPVMTAGARNCCLATQLQWNPLVVSMALALTSRPKPSTGWHSKNIVFRLPVFRPMEPLLRTAFVTRPMGAKCA